MDDDLKKRADRRLEEALESAGAPDPRDRCRDLLRALRGRDRDAYEREVEHYETVLLPRIAGGEADPLEAWQDFGRRLAERIAEGRTVEIDLGGRSHRHEPPAEPDRLVLHLPHDSKEPALLVAVPAEPTSAQRATLDLLVRGKRTLQ